jgi:hypothetical protein
MNFKECWALCKPYLPASFFASGFILDAITLGIAVSFVDLCLLSAYSIVLILLFFWQIPFKPIWIEAIKQFCVGGLYSALSIFYFKSSDIYTGYLFFLILFSLLVWNEFWNKGDVKKRVYNTVLCLGLIMYANFLIPHLILTIHWSVFYLSLLLVAGIFSIKYLWLQKEKRWLKEPVALLFVFAFLYYLNIIPPVPLVLKEQFACQDLIPNKYSCKQQRKPWYDFSDVIYIQSGKSIVVMGSIFAPTGVEAQLEHKWWFNDVKKGWTNTDNIPLFIGKGGRAEGWRLYSTKYRWQPGEWKVETAVQGGSIVSSLSFSIKKAQDQRSWENRALK